MTVSSTTNKMLYTGDDATSVFPYTFKIFADSDLEVIKTVIATGVETTLVLTTDYTVSGAGEAAGGNVTLVAGALASEYSLSIKRNIPLLQEFDLEENDNAASSSYENAFDKNVMQIQAIREEIDRCIKLGIATTGVSLTLPVPEANYYLAWNSAGTAIVNQEPNVVDSSVIADGAITTEKLADGAVTQAKLASSTPTLSTTNPSLEYADGGLRAKVDGTTVNRSASGLTAIGVIPSGGIIIWSGAISAIPSGWVICDGNNSTPDLTDRFVIHADADSGGTNDVDDTGGASTHTHDVGSYAYPNHAHSGTTDSYAADAAGTPDEDQATGSHTHTFTSDTDGGGAITGTSASGSNRDKYYALAYIMKT